MKKVFIILFLFVAAYTFSQQKYALVIGNGDYTGISKLRNPVNDANDMAVALKDLGFTVQTVINGNLEQMEEAAMNLKRLLGASRDSYGFFYYAGHGVQSNGENYLIPVNASGIISESHLRQRAFSVQTLLDNLNDARNELNMIILDACRDNPFGWSRSGSRGLTLLSSPLAGSIIMYATSANASADDGSSGNGLFTSQLLKNLKTPGLSVRDIFDRTGEDVIRVSNGLQHPELSIRFFAASTTYLGSRPDSAVQITQVEPLTVPRAYVPADLAGAWVRGDTRCVFSTDSLSISWKERDNETVGYTISPVTYAAANNTSDLNRNYQSGYRVTGKVISSTVPSFPVGMEISRLYLLDKEKISFWNRDSSTYVIYYKE